MRLQPKSSASCLADASQTTRELTLDFRERALRTFDSGAGQSKWAVDPPFDPQHPKAYPAC